MIAGTYNIQDTIKGDTLDEIRFTLKDESDDYINLTGYSIKAMFKPFPSLVSVKTIQIGTGITIINAAEGRFKIDSFNVDFAVGVYMYDIQFTSSGVVKTYIKGEFNVLPEITT